MVRAPPYPSVAGNMSDSKIAYFRPNTQLPNVTKKQFKNCNLFSVSGIYHIPLSFHLRKPPQPKKAPNTRNAPSAVTRRLPLNFPQRVLRRSRLIRPTSLAIPPRRKPATPTISPPQSQRQCQTVPTFFFDSPVGVMQPACQTAFL